MTMKNIRFALSLIVLMAAMVNVSAQQTSGDLKSSQEVVEDAKSQVSKISVDELKVLIDGGDDYLLIDVRTEEEYLAGHIEGAVWIPRGKLEFKIQALTDDPNTKMILNCRTGGRSALSVLTLMEMGYKNVNSLTGGFKEWVVTGNSVYNRHGAIKVVAFEEKEGGM